MIKIITGLRFVHRNNGGPKNILQQRVGELVLEGKGSIAMKEGEWEDVPLTEEKEAS